MKKIKSFQELATLSNNSTNYKGKLPRYQQKSHKKDFIKQKDKLNSYQNMLYSRAVYGLSVYSDEEVKEMHWDKKRRIKRVNKRAQISINLLKQEKVNLLCDNLYTAVFPNSSLAKQILSLENSSTDPHVINTLDLKFLKIDKTCIIKEFIEKGVLPKNFYTLTNAT